LFLAQADCPGGSAISLGVMIRTCVYILILFIFCGAAHAAQIDLSESDVMALQKTAEAGDRGAVRQLFGFYPRSDGAVTENIDMILGNVTRHYPRLFLEELKRSNAGHGKCTTVGNTLELTDQIDEQIEELRARRESLLSVDDAPLRKLRDDCVRELDEDIQIFVNAQKQMKDGQ
jgi:hypothetical protein